jgi:hypothetical protein
MKMKQRKNVYMAYIPPQATAANKYLLALLNTEAGQRLRIFDLRIINGKLTAVSGVGVELDIIKITAIVGGTDVTPTPCDGKDPALAGVTSVYAATSVTAGATMFSVFENNDEIALTNPRPEHPQNILPHPIVCYDDQGIAVKQITDSTVGSFGILCLFERELI